MENAYTQLFGEAQFDHAQKAGLEKPSRCCIAGLNIDPSALCRSDRHGRQGGDKRKLDKVSALRHVLATIG
jgi:hypothetical protein